MSALERAATTFPQGEYRDAARRVFVDEIESVLKPLLIEAFEEFVDGLIRIQGYRGESNPRYLAQKLIRDIVQPPVEKVLTLAIREKQLKHLDRRTFSRYWGLKEDVDPRMTVSPARILSEQARMEANKQT